MRPSRSVLLQASIAVVAAGVLGAGSLTVATSGQDAAPRREAARRSAAPGTSEVARGGTPGRAPRDAPAVAAGRGAPTTGSTVGTNAVKPPEPGTYRYHLNGSGTFAGQKTDQEGTIDVTHGVPTRVAAGWRQRVVTRSEEGSQTLTHEWRTDRVLTIASGSGRDQCTYDPPVLDLRWPLRIGASWTQQSATCKETGDGRSGQGGGARMTIEVLRRETLRIGGTAVDCFVLQGTAQSNEVGRRFKVTMTRWFSTDFRLEAKLFTEVESDFGSGHLEQLLVDLEPR